MATLEEQQQTLDNIKGPRYYRIQLWGYGGEHAYGKLTKEAYDFWKPIVDEHGDGDLISYFLGAEDGEFDFENIDSVPPEADFLRDDDYVHPWYEMPTEFEHLNSVSIDSANIEINEVQNSEYSAPHIATVLENENLNDVSGRVSEETDWEVDILESVDDLYPEKGTHIVQFLSMEKGTFFEGIIETVGDFDIKKLRVTYSEAPNGEDVIHTILYDGKEIDNDGGDTNGKGYAASVWTQEY